MKFLLSAMLAAVMLFCPHDYAFSEVNEHYDPQHTVLALNMAVVSI